MKPQSESISYLHSNTVWLLTGGLTVTPSAKELRVGINPLSGGGWKEPQYGYWVTYLAIEIETEPRTNGRWELRNTLTFVIYNGLDESPEVLIDRQECVIMGKLSSKHRSFSQNGGIMGLVYLVCSIAKPLSSNVSRDNKCKILGL